MGHLPHRVGLLVRPEVCSWGCPPEAFLGLPLTFPVLGSLLSILYFRRTDVSWFCCEDAVCVVIPPFLLLWGDFQGQEGN